MKNEGDGMKRFLCALLVLCLIPVCVSAADFSDFNMYAYLFGEEEIDFASGVASGNFVICHSDGCTVSYKEEDGEVKTIVVEGDGLPFVAYAMAAIMFFEPDSSSYIINAGRFLSAFLLFRRDHEPVTRQVTLDTYFGIRDSEKGFLVLVGK